MAVLQFIDLKAQQAKIRTQIEQAIKRVLDHGIYILGPEVAELEQKLAEFCGVKHVIGCANGTDALLLCLMAKNIGPGDAVFVPSFTFAATAEAVVLRGAQPVFIDSLPDTFNIDPHSLFIGIATAKQAGLKPKGIIAVDLFGQPADYDSLQELAEEHNLWVLADAAQSFGAAYKERNVGNIGDLAATSFFPAKPLGCYGDGGAVFTNDDELAALIKSLHVHGQGTHKYNNIRVGLNSRLDSIQAAILLEKLKIFPEELTARQKIADHYNNMLQDYVTVPVLPAGLRSAWAQYTIRLSNAKTRADLIHALKERGIPTALYYAKPLHLQDAYKKHLIAGTHLPSCEKLAHTVLSLPMHAYLEAAELETICNTIIQFVAEHGQNATTKQHIHHHA